MSDETRPCEICGVTIDPERAADHPKTRLCEGHAKQIVKYGGEFIASGSVERTSKPGSMKKNYGGVSVSLRRNQQAIDKLKDDFDREQWEKKKKSGA
jgi:hypothetical protein